MNLRTTVLSGIFAASIALSGGATMAQSATPDATPAEEATAVVPVTVSPKAIKTADGQFVGYATMWEDEAGVHIVLKSSGDAVLAPGEHGVHIHQSGVCDDEAAFDSAGGHFNPTDEAHGDLDADPSHGGDLGNMTVADDGSFEHKAVVSKITLQPEEANSLNDADGSAIVIHAGEDDLATDPSGESGDREACGVIFAPIDGMGTPEATPAN